METTMSTTDANTNAKVEMTPAGVIDAATDIGLLSLTVADLERSLAFYTRAIGFTAIEQAPDRALLGAGGAVLLELIERPGAAEWPGYATGLYHFAILVPTREALGKWLRHWLNLGLPMPGQGDHLVSEALYLNDPDGNGIEVYRDRPRSEWTWDGGMVRMATDPVDIRGVLAAGDRDGVPFAGLPAGTRIGHMHLQVSDIPTTRAFYHDVLGFDVVAEMPTALFMSAGGYHHHIGANIWHSRGQGPAPDGVAGLRYFTITLPTEAARDMVLARLTGAGSAIERTPAGVVIHDPSQNRILLQVGAAQTAG
jgi:catechol 2,3-dioxygenase